MVLKAFTEYTQAPLEVQYEPGGKVYRIPPMTIEAAAFIRAQAADPDAAREAAKGKPDDWITRIVLGPLWDEMIADRVPATFADRVYLTALAEHTGGREYAEHIFAEGVDPLVLKAYLEGQTPLQDSKPSPRTGTATRTPSRASSRATTSKAPRQR
jgi:hypothetical protein